MKICHTHAMKMIKELEEQKRLLIEKEDENCIVSYKEGEERLPAGYDYDKMREEIRSVDGRVCSLRAVLAKANCTVTVEPFGITIGEALVMLAQLQAERGQIESLAGRKQVSRRITSNGVVEYSECVYDVSRAAGDVKALREKIAELQMAIDRANLTNYVEI